MTRDAATPTAPPPPPLPSPPAQSPPSLPALHSPPTLPDDVLRKVIEYVPSTARSLLPLCSLNHAWRRVATCDDVWEPATKQEYGQLLLERLGVAKGVHRFYLGQQHARFAYQSLLRPQGPAGEMVCCTPPPDSFFSPFTWILEIREGRDKSLVYSAAVGLKEVEDRGRLFTSSGHSIVGDGLRLGIDVKSRLRPPPANFDGGGGVLPRRRRNSSVGSGLGGTAGAAVVVESEGGGGGEEGREEEGEKGPAVVGGECEGENNNHNQEENGGAESGVSMKKKKAAGAAAAAADATDNEDNEDEDTDEDEEEEASLLFTLSLYNKHTHTSACFISTRLLTDRPPRWQGRFWDGPFSGADGQPTTRVVLDPTHTLTVLPIVEMADWGDKTFLLRVRVDLRICQCAEEEEGGREGGVLNSETGRMVQGGCRCSPFDGLGMIHEEGTWILLRDLLANKLRWF